MFEILGHSILDLPQVSVFELHQHNISQNDIFLMHNKDLRNQFIEKGEKTLFHIHSKTLHMTLTSWDQIKIGGFKNFKFILLA